MKLNIDKIREDFPVLNRRIYKKPLIYLDNAATNQKPQQVIDRLEAYYSHENSNIHRGVHFLSQEATSAFEQARQDVTAFLNAGSTSEIIFTKGTTESVNLVASSFGRKFIHEGDEVLITRMEHHSNIVPWQLMCEIQGAELRICGITKKGEIDMESFDALLNEKTKLVAFTHVSNTLGTINPIREMIEKAHRAGAKVLIDGAQAVVHLKVDVQDLDCDFYCFSAHKIYGPMGVGVLYGKENLLEEMPPYQGGGEMIATVSFDKTTYNQLPFKFEAGTPNVGGVIGMQAALRYLNELGLENIAAHEDDLLNYATDKLRQLGGMDFYGESEHKTGVISFNISGVHSYDAGTIIDKFGVAVRTGHLCTQPLADFYGIPGFIRASFAVYNTRQEVDTFAEAVSRSREMLL